MGGSGWRRVPLVRNLGSRPDGVNVGYTSFQVTDAHVCIQTYPRPDLREHRDKSKPRGHAPDTSPARNDASSPHPSRPSPCPPFTTLKSVPSPLARTSP